MEAAEQLSRYIILWGILLLLHGAVLSFCAAEDSGHVLKRRRTASLRALQVALHSGDVALVWKIETLPDQGSVPPSAAAAASPWLSPVNYVQVQAVHLRTRRREILTVVSGRGAVAQTFGVAPELADSGVFPVPVS